MRISVFEFKISVLVILMSLLRSPRHICVLDRDIFIIKQLSVFQIAISVSNYRYLCLYIDTFICF